MLQAIDKQIFNRLTRLYLFALTAVAILSFCGQLVIQLFLNDLLEDAHVVNIAGRQRMLSQKLSKTAAILCNPEIFNSNSNGYLQDSSNRNELAATTELWRKSHLGLMNGKLEAEKFLEVKNSPKISKLFQELNPIFITIYDNSKILTDSKNISKIIQKEALSKILANESKFLKLMNNIVTEYDIEAQKRVSKTKKIELLIFSLLFFVLLIEGFFIFKPIAYNIRLVIRKLAESESKLQTANQDLRFSNQTILDTRKELLAATQEKYKLQLAEEKIRSSSLVEGQELERKRLAQELHDGIGQMLTGIKLQAEHLKSFSNVSEKQGKSYQDLQALINETIEATRTVSFNLAPSVLNDFGLSAAIRILAEQSAKAGNIKIEFEANLAKRLPENIEIGLYRITQEAINNAIKHAFAGTINIKLSEGKNTQLSIVDNGVGFDVSKIRTNINLAGGSGINNMYSRTQLLNGKFKIESAKKKGTKITVTIPKNDDSKY
jgi:signal transduction histidine kinase